MQLPVFSWPHESEGLTGCSKGCWFLQASLLAAKPSAAWDPGSQPISLYIPKPKPKTSPTRCRAFQIPLVLTLLTS